ncbi:MAG: hypothetical protein KDD43_08985, partial [Bdellovibrionales bacterium]|nr:hypothetical protein [Bdellovibrionales bacterium]
MAKQALKHTIGNWDYSQGFISWPSFRSEEYSDFFPTGSFDIYWKDKRIAKRVRANHDLQILDLGKEVVQKHLEPHQELVLTCDGSVVRIYPKSKEPVQEFIPEIKEEAEIEDGEGFEEDLEPEPEIDPPIVSKPQTYYLRANSQRKPMPSDPFEETRDDGGGKSEKTKSKPPDNLDLGPVVLGDLESRGINLESFLVGIFCIVLVVSGIAVGLDGISFWIIPEIAVGIILLGLGLTGIVSF